MDKQGEQNDGYVNSGKKVLLLYIVFEVDTCLHL